MARLFTALALSAACLISGERVRRRVGNISVLQDDLPPTCDQFANMPLIRGRNFSVPITLACKYWPEKYGEFPIQTVGDAIDILGQGGSVWDLLDLIKKEHEDDRFCYRQSAAREIAAEGSSCEMEVGGVCYGSCPAGFKPKFLLGTFKPSCDTACVATTHPFGCGFGCSRDFRTCATLLFDKVKEVLSVVGVVGAGFMAVLDQVIAVVDFVFDVVVRLVKEATKAWDKYDGDEITWAVLVTIFMEVIDNAQWLHPDLERLYEMIGEIMESIIDLIDGERRGVVTTSFVSEWLIKSGLAAVPKMVEVIKVFIYPSCQALDTTVVFAVEDAGREEVLGPYIQRGEKNGHPYYTHKKTTKRGVEYDKDRQAWSMFAHVRMGIFKKSFYQVKDAEGVEHSDFPVEGWVRNYGAEPAPTVVPLREPAA